MKIEDMLQSLMGLLVMVYGRSGSGKTKCWGHLPAKEGLVILSEANGVRTIKRMFPDTYQGFEIEFPRSVHEFHELVVAQIEREVGWVVIDTVTSYYAMLWDEYMAANKLEPADVEFKNYNHCLHYFNNLMIRLVDLANSGTHVFLTCHLKWQKEGPDKNIIQWTAPDLPGKLPELVNRRLDVLVQAECIRLGQDTHYRLFLPHGRSSGKDLLGALDNGPITNDFQQFLQFSGRGGATADNPTKCTPGVSAPEPASPSPPSSKKKLLCVTNKRGKIPAGQKKLLQVHMKAAKLDEEYVNEWCKKEMKREGLHDLTMQEFARLSMHVSTLAQAQETF